MQAENKPRIPWLRILGTLLAVALLAYLLAQQGWDEIWAAVSAIELPRFLFALLLMFGSRACVIGRWHVLLRSGEVPATWGQSTRITFAGLFANHFLPSTVGGDVARLGGALQAGFDAATSAASLAVDRVVGLVGMGLATPIGLARLFGAAIASALAAPSLALAAQPGWLGRLWARGLHLLRRLGHAMKLWLQHPRALLASLLFTLGHMFFLFSAMYVLLQGLNDPLPLWLIAGLWSMVYMVTLVPFTINAFGLQELSIAFAFTQLGGISAANSAALALLVRTLFLLASLPGALFLSDVLPGVARAKPILSSRDQEA